MKITKKELAVMKNLFSITLVAVSLVFTSCEIPDDLNDNPNEITL